MMMFAIILLFQIMIFNSVQPPRWQTSDIYYDATLHHRRWRAEWEI